MRNPILMGPRAGVFPVLCLTVLLAAACGATSPSSATTPGPGTTGPASGTGNRPTPAPTAAATTAPTVAATTAPTAAATTAAASIAAGPKATTCRELLSDGEVSQATGLANATLKSVDVAVSIGSETHCRFDAGSTAVEVSVWSGDRLSAFDQLSSGMSNPVTLDIPGATASFYDLSFMGLGMARTADHGVAVNMTPGDTPIPDMKAAAIALLRMVLGRI